MDRVRSSDRPAVRVLCGSFEDLVAIGLRELIAGEQSLELVGDGVSPERLPSAIAALAPDVVLVGYGSLAAPSSVAQLRRARPQSHVVVLANRPTANECSELLAAGATACISKDTQARDIVNAIHLASRGLHLLPRTAVGGPLAGADDGERVTAREAEVLELLRRGCTNAEIAHALSISIETVRTHARHIYRKLGVSSRRDLVRAARHEQAQAEPVVVD